MLTLESILAGIDGLPTLVFDEIDERAEWDCGGGRGRKDKVRGRKDMEDEHIGPHLARHRRKVRRITHPDPKGIEHGSHQEVVASPRGHNLRAGAASPAAQGHRSAEELPPVSSPLIREPPLGSRKLISGLRLTRGSGTRASSGRSRVVRRRTACSRRTRLASQAALDDFAFTSRCSHGLVSHLHRLAETGVNTASVADRGCLQRRRNAQAELRNLDNRAGVPVWRCTRRGRNPAAAFCSSRSAQRKAYRTGSSELTGQRVDARRVYWLRGRPQGRRAGRIRVSAESVCPR